MNIGIVGAGKMGFTIGKHLVTKKVSMMNSDNSTRHINYDLIGYYSKNYESAKEAALFTESKSFKSLNELIEICDTIFLTVPDGQITAIVDELSRLDCDLSGKIICHTSGALTSSVFSGMNDQVLGYSVHPIYAVNSKMESYKNFSNSFITIEGDARSIDKITDLFCTLGHRVKVISDKDKAKYHCAAVFASNLVISVYSTAIRLLEDCGFEKDEAGRALVPLFANNAENIINVGAYKALTGPVERCDDLTIKKHLDCLDDDDKELYSLLTKQLIDIAIKKHMCESVDSSNSVSYEEEVKRYNKIKKLIDLN